MVEFISFLEHALSQLVGLVMRVPIPSKLRKPVLMAFVKITGINPNEAAMPLSKYRSIDDFFTRSLHPSIRPMSVSTQWVSPCDGRILDFGLADEDQFILVKDQPISIADFFPKFKVAQFMVIYLSPKDCHQIMMPVEASIHSIQFFPGGLSTVRPSHVVAYPEILFRNARLNFNLEAASQKATMIMVGALNVSSVSTPFSGQKRLPRNERSQEIVVKQNVKQGEKVGTFHLGSTIVLLFEKPISFDPSFVPGYKLFYGQSLISK